MKIISHFHGIYHNKMIILKLLDESDRFIVEKLFTNKSERENRTKKEILLRCEINAPYQNRTYKQNNAVWALVGIIFQSMENRKGTHEELYDLYSSLLEEYADRKPSLIGDRLRIVHLSEMNTEQCGRFIDGILYYIASTCDLKIDLQTSVRKIIYEWEEWRGKQEIDINDNRTPEEMRKRVIYSEASGRQPVELHHIISRGACPLAIDKAWNLVALTHDEHMEFHQKGWDYFLEKYPHLKGKFERAKKKCSELVQESHSLGTENLADLALSMQK